MFQCRRRAEGRSSRSAVFRDTGRVSKRRARCDWRKSAARRGAVSSHVGHTPPSRDRPRQRTTTPGRGASADWRPVPRGPLLPFSAASGRGMVKAVVPPNRRSAVRCPPCRCPRSPSICARRTTSPSPPATCRPGSKFSTTAARSTLSAAIGLGHKIALRPISKGEASTSTARSSASPARTSPPGDHVHVHNVAADAFERDYAFCRDCPPPPPRPPSRAPGWATTAATADYGTRNYIAIISTVNCSASTSKYISERFRATDLLQAISQRRWRGGHHAQGRLRHAVRRPRPQPARPHAGRLRQASQRRRPTSWSASAARPGRRST